MEVHKKVFLDLHLRRQLRQSGDMAAAAAAPLIGGETNVIQKDESGAVMAIFARQADATSCGVVLVQLWAGNGSVTRHR